MPNHPYNDDKRLLELLERWQSGDFTRADEQELQGLTGSDEFRREAMEGYRGIPEEDHDARLASLQQRLRQRQGGALRVNYLRILAAVAALAVLVLAVIWLIPEQAPLAPVAKNETPGEPIVSTAPSSSQTETATRAPRTAPAPAPEPAAKLEQKIQDQISRASDKELDANTSVASEAAKPAPEAPGAVVNTARQAASQEVPQDVASQSENESDVDTRAGNAGPFKKKPSDYSKAKAAGKPKMDTIASAASVTDWADFQNYLRRTARLTEAARQHNVSGSVQVRFELDSDNQPQRFQILRSLGYGCDEEAVRLIKNYSWQRGDQRTLTVDVPFVR